MQNKIIYFLILMIIFALPVCAEKIPVKIAPIQIISTHDDQIEVGDKLDFETVNDIYCDNNLIIKKGTKVIGFVDFFHQNGWGGDSAEIKLKRFQTKDVNEKTINFESKLVIKGSQNSGSTKGCAIIYSSFHNLISWGEGFSILGLIRGSEVFVEPDTTIYNIFIEQ